MPALLDLAAADLQSIIENEGNGGTSYTLINDNGEYPVVGIVGDIGALIDPITGEAIQSRAIEATVIAQTILAAAGAVPARGWKARIKETVLFVQRNEYDRTIGLCRLSLGLILQEEKDE